ncbi:MAG: LamG domain-containing protein [Nitrospirae bacterium]|nr:LamG domain-containing protein [Nitrospirota bacterium]
MKQMKNKSVFFLTGAILILCASFAIMSCGNDPQQKVQEINAGAFAIDCTRAPLNSANKNQCGAFVFDPNLLTRADIAGKEFTVEAWIKNKASGKLNGGIFSRYGGVGGMALYVKDDVLKFRVKVGSNYFTLAANVSLPANEWRHVAGVLANANHTGVHSACAGAESQTPHMDIYVNGIFSGCASTDSKFVPTDEPPATGENPYSKIFMGIVPDLVGTKNVDENTDGVADETNHCTVNPSDPVDPKYNPGLDGLCHDQRFEGMIDEVRFWAVARTPEAIVNCMGNELDHASALCRIDTTTLKGYWRFNEGEGASANDISGYGFAGAIFSPFSFDFKDAWTTDSPL